MDLSIYTEIVALFIMCIVFIISIIGCFVPVIPGPLLAFIAILCYKLCLPESTPSWDFVIISAVLMIVAQTLDIILTFLGAKKLGATWKGTLGAIIGVILGLFITPQIVWIFLAPILCAFAFEFLGGSSFKNASKAGIGAFLGTILSIGLKIAIVFAMIVGFFLSLNIFSIS